jgi:hypothetical protein
VAQSQQLFETKLTNFLQDIKHKSVKATINKKPSAWKVSTLLLNVLRKQQILLEQNRKLRQSAELLEFVR